MINKLRRFQIHGTNSNPVASCCGLPEGCTLSCLSMGLVHQLYDAIGHWFRSPRLWLTSILIIGRSLRRLWLAKAAPLQPLRPLLISWTGSWILTNLIVGFHIVPCALISELCVCPLSLPAGTWELIWFIVVSFAMPRSWPILIFFLTFRTNWVPPMILFIQKCEVTRIAAYRVLQSISAAALGCKCFESLRTRALQALNFSRPGVNPYLPLLFDRGLLDPQLFSMVVTFRDQRVVGSAPHQLAQLGEFAILNFRVPCTVSSLLVQRYHQLGWAVSESGLVIDFYGFFSVHEVSWQELELPIYWSWNHVVAQSICHRFDLAVFLKIDIASTRDLLGSFNNNKRGIYHKVCVVVNLLTNGEIWW